MKTSTLARRLSRSARPRKRFSNKLLLVSACLALLPLSGCEELGSLLGPEPSSSPSAAAASPNPSAYPSSYPTAYPTSFPTTYPTVYPTSYPTSGPTTTPQPTALPPSQPGVSSPVSPGFVDQPAESVLLPSRFVMPSFPLSAGSNGSLSLSRNYFKPGKPISLGFVAGTGYTNSAWVGIIPAEITHGSEDLNGQHDLAWKYLDGKASGALSFNAPMAEQNYDFRLHDRDDGGSETASVSFTVTRELPPEETALTHLSLAGSRFKPGKPVVLRFTAPASFDKKAWIGLLPADKPHGEEAENDKHDLAWRYLDGQTSGEMTFTAPSTEGSYDLRLHDNETGGKEACYVSFTVSRELPATEVAASSMRLDRTVYAPGAPIKLSFTAPASFDKKAWIGLLPADKPHGEEAENDKYDLAWKYLDGQTGGEMSFNAPSQPGSYDFRMHDNETGGKEVVYVSFTVAG